jgi:hypothetical protein
MTDTSPCNCWTLRDLPFAARLTIAAFLISAGFGYFSGLVNLHFQTASPGEAMPTPDDAQRDFRGTGKSSQLERLLVAHPSLPFNGQGSMRSVFTKQRAAGWAKARKARAKDLGIVGEDFANLDKNDPKKSKDIDKYVAALFDGERLALIAWIRDGASKETYEADAFPLKGPLAKLPINPNMLDENAPKDEPAAKIKSIIETKCARCHADNVGGVGAQFPLEKYEDVALYISTERSTGKSLSKLAMTTHVHLLGFSMLYGMTGILFALTGYWRVLRVLIGPLPIVVQAVEISFWWLAKMDDPYGPQFVEMIRICGGIIALGVGLQILGTLFWLFGKYGKAVLFGMILAAVLGIFGIKDKLTEYLANEKTAAGIEAIEK